MIVKVQMPLNKGGKEALVYNKDKSILAVMPVGFGLRQRMKGRSIAFFYAVEPRNASNLLLKGEAPKQDW